MFKAVFQEFLNSRPSDDSNISAKTIAIYKNNILLLQNPDKTYELPGGHIKKNEPVMVGAAREFFEETGLVVNLIKTIMRRSDRVIYTGKLNSKNVKISKEHIGYKFIPINKINKMKLSKKAHKDLHFLKTERMRKSK